VEAFEEVAAVEAQGICQISKRQAEGREKRRAEADVKVRESRKQSACKFNRVAGDGQFIFKIFAEVGEGLP
jgi:hypothetical protein